MAAVNEISVSKCREGYVPGCNRWTVLVYTAPTGDFATWRFPVQNYVEPSCWFSQKVMDETSQSGKEESVN